MGLSSATAINILAVLSITALALIVLILLVGFMAGRRREHGSSSQFSPLTAPIGDRGWAATETMNVEGELYRSHRGRGSDIVKERIVERLSKIQSIPIEDLLTSISNADRDTIISMLRELEKEGFIRIEGGLILLSERGEKLLARLREKYIREEYKRMRPT
ncbi:MAG: hypothetical protein ABWW69_00870 [Pyrodictiaceae archaeon]